MIEAALDFRVKHKWRVVSHIQHRCMWTANELESPSEVIHRRGQVAVELWVLEVNEVLLVVNKFESNDPALELSLHTICCTHNSQGLNLAPADVEDICKFKKFIRNRNKSGNFYFAKNLQHQSHANFYVIYHFDTKKKFQNHIKIIAFCKIYRHTYLYKLVKNISATWA